jgi:hypothetical protein
MPRDRRNAIQEAGGKLAEYTDHLWAGRETASASLSRVYTDRLASAAKMASMMQQRQPLDALVALFRREDHAFPRDLLATDAGREARSAFNALGRAIRALEDPTLSGRQLPTGPQVIVDKQLSAVTFVLDYLQLSFDGPGFTVLCPARIRTPSNSAQRGEDGFRDQICAAIGHIVKSVTVNDRAVSIELDGCEIVLDLSCSSAGPEKLIFNDTDGGMTVWN